jgi:hypothetical protein
MSWDVEAPAFSVDSRLIDGGTIISLTRCPPFTPLEDSSYSFLLEDESTPGPQCGWKDYVNWKIQWPHRDSNPRLSGPNQLHTTRISNNIVISAQKRWTTGANVAYSVWVSLNDEANTITDSGQNHILPYHHLLHTFWGSEGDEKASNPANWNVSRYLYMRRYKQEYKYEGRKEAVYTGASCACGGHRKVSVPSYRPPMNYDAAVDWTSTHTWRRFMWATQHGLRAVKVGGFESHYFQTPLFRAWYYCY